MGGLKVGDIDIADQVVDHEYKVKLLFKIIEFILSRNHSITGPTTEEVSVMSDEILKEMQKRFPNSGIKLNK